MKVRRQCVEILTHVLETGAFINTLKEQISETERPFGNMLLLTTLRRLENLKQILQKFLHKKIPAKDKAVYYVLLLGAAEILYLATPDYAAINEYVNIAKKKAGRFPAGMVNAVLRQIAAQKENLNTVFNKGAFPLEFKRILIKDYKVEEIKKMEEILHYEPPLDIIPKQDAVGWAQKLNAVLFSNGTLRLAKADKVSELEGYAQGQWWVQDLAASLPVLLLGDIKNKKVLDLCAAPGGKTAQLLAAGAEVTALDIDAERVEKLKENIWRLQLTANLTTIVSDAVLFLENCRDLFDVIVIDAPCSATGTFRRHPEVLHHKTIADVEKQKALQKTFLQKAANKLKTGGKILYCTCSIAKSEGERQVESFLNKNHDFRLCPVDMENLQRYEGINLDKNIIDKGVLRTLPYYMKDIGGMDAFFAACLQKNEGEV